MRLEIRNIFILLSFFIPIIPVTGQQLITSQSGTQIYWIDQNNWYIKNSIKAEIREPETKNNKNFLAKKKVLIEELLKQEAINTVELYMNQLDFSRLEKAQKHQTLSSNNPLENIRDSLSYNQQKRNIIHMRLSNIAGLIKQVSSMQLSASSDKRLSLIKNSMNSMKSSLNLPSLSQKKNNTELSEFIDFSIVPIDVIENPPEAECAFSFSGPELISGKQRIDLVASPLFSHTHSQLAEFFVTEDYLNCSIKLSWIGGFSYLTLIIKMNSSKANLSYGSIQKGSPLHIELIDGEKVYLRSVKHSVAQIDEDADTTSYDASFVLDKSRLNDFADKEVSKISIVWSKGIEKYDVQFVDALQMQAKCLKNKLK